MPADNKWTAVFDGMLLELCYRHNWEQDGDMSPEDMAQWFSDHYADFTKDATETPYSESAEDIDGLPEAPWYENVYDWIIAGFLAITFSEGAAIIYQATIPKLRMAIRTGNLGALFRVIVNGVEAWSGDSYSASVSLLEHDLDLTAYGNAPYTIRIEHNGSGPNIPNGTAAKLEYVRNEAVAQMGATILRADPSGCGVQWSTDNGDTWETVDLSTCIAGIADDRITNWVTDGGLVNAVQNAIDDGLIKFPASTYPPANSPAAGECKTFHVVLRANEQWVCPVNVEGDYTIQITNASGGWCDGSIVWRCPDGSYYFGGACQSGGKTHIAGDPSATAYHMAIIGKLLTDGTFFDPMTGVYAVPTGTASQLFVLQANDASLSDNFAEVQFDITICNGQWCRHFGTGYDQDWTGWETWNASGVTAYPVLQADGSWHGTTSGSNNYCDIRHRWQTPYHVLRLRSTQGIPGGTGGFYLATLNANAQYHQLIATANSPNWDASFNGDAVYGIAYICEVHNTPTIDLTSLIANGYGDSPYISNC